MGSTPTLGTKMESNTKSYKILVTVSLFALVSLITIAMFAKVRYSTSPEGLFENYKWWIVESVEKWTKDRDNEYYSKQKVIDWYETKQADGAIPKNNFPDFIYSEIKLALSLVFESQELSSKDPDQAKEIVAKKIDSRKDNIIDLINTKGKKNFLDSMTTPLIDLISYLFMVFVAIFFIAYRIQ